jgi:DNA-binding response OmpR family regulator
VGREQSLRVLVIEDSSQPRRSLCNGLRHEGFTVDTAGHALEGLGGLSLDTAQQNARVGAQQLPLTRTEFSLLVSLALSRGSGLSQESLHNQLYTSEAGISSNVIDVMISTLRRKIRAAGGSALNPTVRGKGYLIT